MKKLRYQSTNLVNYNWDKIALKKVLIKKNTVLRKFGKEYDNFLSNIVVF